ncbi:MAG: Bug family tripartite tricarboxylate transporter substrate binding protein [Rubrivivax sp.]
MVNSQRRSLVIGAASAAGALSLPTWAQADYPNQPIKLVVPFPPGGSTDIAARVVGEHLSLAWKQPVNIENRAGAGGSVGAEAVSRAAPDGYTVIMGVTGSHAINISLNPKLKYHPLRDFEPVTTVGTLPNVLVAHPSVSARTLPELIALAKREPGKLSYASLGNGTAAHLTFEMLKQLAGVDILHVPYGGSGPAITAMLAGNVQLMIDGLPSSVPHIQAGKMRPLAVTSLMRSPAAPDVPTIAESGFPGFSADAWNGLYVPKGTPAAIVEKLQAQVAQILKLPAVQERFASLGLRPVGNSPAEARAFTQAEIDKWARFVKASGATVD